MFQYPDYRVEVGVEWESPEIASWQIFHQERNGIRIFLRLQQFKHFKQCISN